MEELSREEIMTLLEINLENPDIIQDIIEKQRAKKIKEQEEAKKVFDNCQFLMEDHMT